MGFYSMGTYSALVVVGGGSAGDAGEEDGAAVVDLVFGAGAVDGEVAVTEESVAEGEEVDVEGLVGTLAERLFHGKLVAVFGPVGVDGSGGSEETEADPRGGVIFVQDIKLIF